MNLATKAIRLQKRALDAIRSQKLRISHFIKVPREMARKCGVKSDAPRLVSQTCFRIRISLPLGGERAFAVFSPSSVSQVSAHRVLTTDLELPPSRRGLNTIKCFH